MTKAAVTKAKALERRIVKLANANHLDSKERFKELQGIHRALDRFLEHLRRVDEWTYTDTSPVEREIFGRAREAFEKAAENYRTTLRHELSVATERVHQERRARHEKNPGLAAYQDELKLSRGGVRDPRRRDPSRLSRLQASLAEAKAEYRTFARIEGRLTRDEYGAKRRAEDRVRRLEALVERARRGHR